MSIAESSSHLAEPVRLQDDAETPFYLGRKYLARAIITATPLVLLDALLTTTFLAIAHQVNGSFTPGIVIAHASLCLVCFFCIGLYPGIGVNSHDECRWYLVATGLLMALFAITTLITNLATILALTTGALALLICRFSARRILGGCGWWGMKSFVICQNGHELTPFDIRLNSKLGLRVAGVFSDQENANPSLPWLGPPSDARRVLARSDYLVELQTEPSPPTHTSIPRIEQLRTKATLVDPPRSHVARILLPHHLAMKRAIDLFVVLLSAIVAIPIAIIVAVTVKLTSPGPIFFSQRRIGKDQRRFSAYKFRTMLPDAENMLFQHLENNPLLKQEWEQDHKLKKDPRLTAIGGFLRKTSIDELPQLWNVLVGDMSLVGPRPIVDAEIEKYGITYDDYHRVRPGITGLWQVNGRNNTTYPERLALDRQYVHNWSIWLDVYILLRTLKVILLREGAY